MKADFTLTYVERLESYLEIVKSTMPGFFPRWILFMLVGLVSGALLISEGLSLGPFGNGYWYILIGSLNAIMFTVITYKNLNLKRAYNTQIKDRGDWKYSIETDGRTIGVKTEKSESWYDKSDLDVVADMKRYLLIRSIYGNSIVLPKHKTDEAFLSSVKEALGAREIHNA